MGPVQKKARIGHVAGQPTIDGNVGPTSVAQHWHANAQAASIKRARHLAAIHRDDS